MNTNRVINDLLAAHRLAWREVWKVSLDLVGDEVSVVLKDGRKFTGPLSPGRGPTPPRRSAARPAAEER